MKNKVILTSLLLFVSFTTCFVYGQNKMQIKGRVTDGQGSLPGVSIIIKGKKQGGCNSIIEMTNQLEATRNKYDKK